MESDRNPNENEVPVEKQKIDIDINDHINKLIDLDRTSSEVTILKDLDKQFLKNLIADAISERMRLVNGSRGRFDNIKLASAIY